MRLYFISVILAAIFLLPSLAELMNFSLNGFEGLLNIPHTGLGYMLVFFHELGHCITFWLFGYPSVPMFDFEYGGGMTYPVMGRLWPLQGVVFAGMAYGIYFLSRRDGFLFDSERL